MDESDQAEETAELLQQRAQLTNSLLELPYDLILYLERAVVHRDLGYPDLAAGDSYRALLLTDEVSNESFEYHELALSALLAHSSDRLPAVLRGHGGAYSGDDLSDELQDMNIDGVEDEVPVGRIYEPLELARLASIRCYQILAVSLLLCGCLKSAYEFCARGLAVEPDDEGLLQATEYIQIMARRRLKLPEGTELDINSLPEQGLVRREIYPWNHHEPNRFSDESLNFLNEELKAVSTKCVAKVTELPTLVEMDGEIDDHGVVPTNKQLGLFASGDIEPGELVLDEISVLTANNRHRESLCDCCSRELPPLNASSTVVGCPDCEDIMFCGEDCLERALSSYHPAVCDKDLESIAKDGDPRESPNALYLLLLARALAMSCTQELHPLDLKEVKYIWGDFLPSASNAVPLSVNAGPPPVWTLPFSFVSNIEGPLHILEKMDIDIFAGIAEYDLWVFNTLYGKFRGTASARVSTRDGRPEVAAVHPLWCLANHDCDPNVKWEWGGRMQFYCRETRVDGRPGGIRAGEEILSHYCDIELPVRERREWAKGSLGGLCMCARCRKEAAEEEKVEVNGKKHHDVEI
ncbi:hypothetical protein F5884DRAFT_664455 [Xylogone sp. PMI_703]|nr:hypothetical protein F5884DRAFT_664455 [Xylogone sp. PMI_703]